MSATNCLTLFIDVGRFLFFRLPSSFFVLSVMASWLLVCLVVVVFCVESRDRAAECEAHNTLRFGPIPCRQGVLAVQHATRIIVTRRDFIQYCLCAPRYIPAPSFSVVEAITWSYSKRKKGLAFYLPYSFFFFLCCCRSFSFIYILCVCER